MAALIALWVAPVKAAAGLSSTGAPPLVVVADVVVVVALDVVVVADVVADVLLPEQPTIANTNASAKKDMVIRALIFNSSPWFIIGLRLYSITRLR